MTTIRESSAGDDLLGDYGTSAAKVEPGGIERIPPSERHGRPWHLFWTWTSPNLEFATVVVGIIGVALLRPVVLAALAAIVVGTGARARSRHGILSGWGPRHGLAQMVLSRTAFGYLRQHPAAPGSTSLIGGHRLVRGQQRQRRTRAARSLTPAQAAVPASSSSPRRCVDRVLRPQPRPRLRAVRLPVAGRRLRDRRVIVFGKADLGAPGSGGLPTTRRVPASRPARRSATPPAGTRTPRTTRATCPPDAPAVRSACSPGLGVFVVLRVPRDRRRGVGHRRRQSADVDPRRLHRPHADLARRS